MCPNCWDNAVTYCGGWRGAGAGGAGQRPCAAPVHPAPPPRPRDTEFAPPEWNRAKKEGHIWVTIAPFGAVMASYGNGWTHHTAPERPRAAPEPAKHGVTRPFQPGIGQKAHIWVEIRAFAVAGSIWDGQRPTAPAPSRAAPRHPVEHGISPHPTENHKKHYHDHSGCVKQQMMPCLAGRSFRRFFCQFCCLPEEKTSKRTHILLQDAVSVVLATEQSWVFIVPTGPKVMFCQSPFLFDRKVVELLTI